jgi:diguanylate cyclase (GGDEF)-like protein/PAS domain S-box-containing protein
MLHADTDGTVDWVNDRWRRITGCWDPLPLDFSVVRDLVVPDDRQRVAAVYATAASALEEFRTETTIAPLDGSDPRHVRLEGAPILTDGTVAGFAGTVLDITELVDAERTARSFGQRYRSLIEEAPIGQVVSSLTGTIVEANPAWCALVGRSIDEVIGTVAISHVHSDDRARVLDATEQLVAGEATVHVDERRLLHADGSIVWVSSSITVERDSAGRAVNFHSTIVDLTARHDAEHRLQRKEQLYRSLVDSLHDGIIVFDQHGVEETNEVAQEILGYPADQLAEPAVYEALATRDEHGGLVPLIEHPGAAVLISGEPVLHRTLSIEHPTRGTRFVLVSAVPSFDGDEVDGAVLTFSDVTASHASDEERARLARIVETTSDLVGISDMRTGRMIYMNRSARALLVGDTTGDIADIRHVELYAPTALATYLEEVAPTVREGHSWSGELTMVRHDGVEVTVQQDLNPELDPDGEVVRVSAMGRDVTERRRIESLLTHRATHDALTGLANRTALLDALEAILGIEPPAPAALLFLDLDRFKLINDRLGHDAGDELLRQVGDRIRSVTRPDDLVARLGGDEFVVLSPGLDDEAAARMLAERVAAAVETRPVVVAADELDVTVSVGIAVSHGTSHPEALLRDADAAMYRAKELGRARLEVFDDDLRRRAATRIAVADELSRGLGRGELTIHLQPAVDLRTGRVTAMEALVRWQHPERGLLSPADFIDVAEDTGIVVGLGLQVLSQACLAAVSWRDDGAGGPPPVVHVNVSARQLATPGLPTLVKNVLETTGLDASRLCLEVTESVLMEDTADAIDLLDALRALGVGLAVDDFGTGYSSLSYLRRLPVHQLKIDRSFVAGLGALPTNDDGGESAIVAAILQLSSSLGLDAVAEGVETREQLRSLQQLGCTSAQGYLFSRPVPVTDAGALVSHRFDVDPVG